MRSKYKIGHLVEVYDEKSPVKGITKYALVEAIVIDKSGHRYVISGEDDPLAENMILNAFKPVKRNGTVLSKL